MAKPKDDIAPGSVDFTVRVPRTLTKELKDLAKKEGNSMGAVTRRILSTGVREEKMKK